MEYDFETGPEDEVMEREAEKARGRWADPLGVVFSWAHVIAPLVRIILALLAALGVQSVREALRRIKENDDTLAELRRSLGVMRHNYETSPMTKLAGEIAAAMGMSDAPIGEVVERARRLFAPVDVEGDVTRLVEGITQAAEAPRIAVRTWITPLVEDHARLRREIELEREKTRSLRIDKETLRQTFDTACEQIATMRAGRVEADAIEVAALRAGRDEALADVERLTQEVKQLRQEPPQEACVLRLFSAAERALDALKPINFRIVDPNVRDDSSPKMQSASVENDGQLAQAYWSTDGTRTDMVTPAGSPPYRYHSGTRHTQPAPSNVDASIENPLAVDVRRSPEPEPGLPSDPARVSLPATRATADGELDTDRDAFFRGVEQGRREALDHPSGLVLVFEDGIPPAEVMRVAELYRSVRGVVAALPVADVALWRDEKSDQIKRLATLSVELISARAANTKLERAVKRLTSLVRALRAQRAEARVGQSALGIKLGDAQGEIAMLAAQRDELVSEATAATNQIADMHREIAKLKAAPEAWPQRTAGVALDADDAPDSVDPRDLPPDSEELPAERALNEALAERKEGPRALKNPRRVLWDPRAERESRLDFERRVKAATSAGAAAGLRRVMAEMGIEQQAPAERLCVAVLVTDPVGRVAVIESAKKGRAWELPGGKVKAGETPRAAAVREVAEELGVQLVEDALEPAGIVYGTPKPGAAFASVIHVFRARAEGELRPGSDAKGACWLHASAVLDLQANGRLSDLQTTHDVLLPWARETVGGAS